MSHPLALRGHEWLFYLDACQLFQNASLRWLKASYKRRGCFTLSDLSGTWMKVPGERFRHSTEKRQKRNGRSNLFDRPDWRTAPNALRRFLSRGLLCGGASLAGRGSCRCLRNHLSALTVEGGAGRNQPDVSLHGAVAAGADFDAAWVNALFFCQIRLRILGALSGYPLASLF